MICAKCSYESGAPRERCPRCGAWGSFASGDAFAPGAWNPRSLAQIKADKVETVKLHHPVLDPFFSKRGGMVRSCSYSFAGEPGAGKSTWALQACQFFQAPLYVAAEEAAGAIKLRAKRLEIVLPNLEIVETNDMELVARNITNEWDALVVDSSHRMVTSDVGGIAGSTLMTSSVVKLVSDIVRRLGIVGIIIGHVNKDLAIAGSKGDEHDVDATCTLTVVRTRSGDETQMRRLKITKNRHGETPLAVMCKMTDRGLDDFEKEEGENGLGQGMGPEEDEAA